jgi:hypothetical protein
VPRAIRGLDPRVGDEAQAKAIEREATDIVVVVCQRADYI